jgi:hypothetical protein
LSFTNLLLDHLIILLGDPPLVSEREIVTGFECFDCRLVVLSLKKFGRFPLLLYHFPFSLPPFSLVHIFLVFLLVLGAIAVYLHHGHYA